MRQENGQVIAYANIYKTLTLNTSITLNYVYYHMIFFCQFYGHMAVCELKQGNAQSRAT